MKHAAAPSPSFIPRFLSVVLLAFAAAAAYADDYLDVNTLLRQGKAAEALTKADATSPASRATRRCASCAA